MDRSIGIKGFFIFLQTSLFLAIALFFVQKVHAQLLINEFSTGSSDDWVELFNNTDQPIDLLGYEVRDNTESNSVSLSGILDPLGTMTLDFSNKLNNSGDTIRLVKKDTQSIIDSVSYGDDGGNPAPLEGQSVGRKPDAGSGFLLFTAHSKGSSNNDQEVYVPPTPTPTNTPTPTRTPTPSKTPTPTKSPTPTKTPTPVTSQEIDEEDIENQSVLTSAIKTSMSQTSQVSSESPRPTAVLGDRVTHADSTQDQNDQREFVKGAQSSRNDVMAKVGFGSVILALCGILGYRKYKYGRYFSKSSDHDIDN